MSQVSERSPRPLKRYNTANEMVEDVFATYAERPAFTYAGQRHSYREIDQLSRQFAVYLQCHLGLVAGDVIALQLPNISQYPVAIYGAIRAGLVIVNINPSTPPLSWSTNWWTRVQKYWWCWPMLLPLRHRWCLIPRCAAL